jgi:tetratricopeptide (TPR) repeat protein
VTALDARLEAAAALVEAGADDEAVAAYSTIVLECGAAADVATRAAAMRAAIQQGFALRRLGRMAEELEAYDVVLDGVAQELPLPLREARAHALLAKAYAVWWLGRHDEALELYEGLIALERAATEPAVRLYVAPALRNLAMVLQGNGHTDEALAALDDLLAWHGGQASPADLADIFFHKGRCMSELGRVDEALDLYARTLALTGDPGDAPFGWLLLYAAAQRASALASIGRGAEALDGMRVALERLRAVPPGRALVAALGWYAGALGEAGRVDEAIAAHERILELAPTIEHEDARAAEAASAVERGHLLEQRGDLAAAAEALRAAFVRFSADRDAETARLVAWAGVHGMELFVQLERRPEAIELAHGVFARYDGSDDPYVRDVVAAVVTALPRAGRSMRLVRRRLG